IPLVFGLVFAEPAPGVIAMVAGALISLRLVRHQPLLKLVFNAANLSLHFTVAAALLPVLLSGRDPLTAVGWLAVLGVTSLTAVMNFSMIVLVIAITERHLDIGQSARAMLFAVVVAAANTIQALITALIIVSEPWAVFLLTCSAGILYIAYRAYVTEREQREKVEFLYASTRALREGGQSGSAVADFLAETASMFRAETVMLYLFPAPDSGVAPALFTQREATFQADAITAPEEAEAQSLAAVAPSPLLVVDEGEGPEEVTEWLAANGVKKAMVGALPSEDRLVGVLVVGDRLGNVTTFTEIDLRLFTTLVEHASVALEKDQLGQALIQLRELGQELERQAKYDELTGLANRTMFTSRLDDLYSTDGNDGSVLYVDLDDFKPVNDTYGHAAGDALLAQVATRIEAATRPDDLAARLGGDEFAVLMPTGTDAEVLAQRLIGALSAPFQIVANEVRIGASVGVAHRKEAASASQLVLHADTALYAAKEEGKGTVVVYGEHLRANMPRRPTLHSDLRRAIDRKEFEIHYQPIVRIDDLSIVGAEALVRWRQPSGRLLPPAEFIHEAEQSGLITSVDRLVRVEVLDRLELFRRMDPRFFISVNLSARHLRRSDLVEEIASDLAASAAPVDGLVFELTESALAGDAEAAAKRLGEVRALGPRIALDDFGTGYSSLSYLRTLPVDIIKIAQPFIQDMTDGDTTFVSAIIGLSQKLGFTTVAEGIELEWAVDILRGMGCDLGQGYHFAHPMELDELTELVGRNQPSGRLAL
ncbi:MAG: EAL domain-containing protein, partial [Acidimicrobiia bacterium]|nr:EAL domain-containing protein [Acidimicrobiia bacterium]